jgi:hypothetical protein
MNPLLPTPALLCKLASVVVHADEILSPNCHEFDVHAMKSLLQDDDIKNWISEMVKMGMAPVKRS